MNCSVAGHKYNLYQDLKTSSLRSVLFMYPHLGFSLSAPSSLYAQNPCKNGKIAIQTPVQQKRIIPIV